MPNGKTLVLAAMVSLPFLIDPLPLKAADDKPPLDELLKAYREWELPLPPKDALLILYETYGGRSVDEVRYAIGFQIEPGTKRLSPKILRGTEAFQRPYNIHLKAIAPKPDSLKKLDCGFHDWLITAIQCHYMGWTPLAESLVTHCQGDDTISPDMALIQPAWDYWVSQLKSPTSDRAKAFKHLKKLIKSDKELDNESNQKLLKSLELALAPSKAKPGSIDALIDDLVDYSATFDGIMFSEHGPRYQRLVEKGFEAVPGLIEHLADSRLTRSKLYASEQCSTNLRVQDVVSYLIEGLAGEESAQDWELRKDYVHTLDKDEVKKWWEQARKVGEEQYAVDHVLPTKSGWEDDHLLHLIAHKYPKHLPRLYKTVLEEHPSNPGFGVANVLSKSKLSKDEKMALFLNAVGRSNGNQRYVAILQIKSLDKERYTKLILDSLENMPKDIDKGEYWTCPEARYASLATDSSDPLVWQALEKATKRAGVGLRTELLQYAAYGHGDELRSAFPRYAYHLEDDEVSDEHRKRLLTFLATFLDDATMRDTSSDPKKYRGPFPGLNYDPPLAVQDYAAMEMAPHFNIEIKLDFHSTREEWAKVREQVRQAWKREQESKDPDKKAKLKD
ncbi:MAG TPA: hypothetical protein VGZ25_12855 [Gemmataceae bacterium]|nr:hypothetical protein [Gemmataceae bacterium]